MGRLLVILGLLLVPTAVMPALRGKQWWIRLWDFPRLQLLGAYLAVGLPLLARRRGPAARALGATLVGCAASQLRWVLPYLPPAPVQTRPAASTDPRRCLRLLVANICMENREADRFVRLVEEVDPDVLVVDEPDAWWERRLRPLASRLPHVVARPLENHYGMMVFSRLDVLESDVRYLVSPNIPSIRLVVKLPSGDLVQVLSVHPEPPAPGVDSEERDVELVRVGLEARESRYPTIVAGDMNDVAWSRTTVRFQEVSGLLDPRRGRGLYSTFSAKVPRVLRYPLDHVFHSPEFRLVHMRTLPAVGSDHLPFLIELSYEPSAAAAGSPAPATAGATVGVTRS